MTKRRSMACQEQSSLSLLKVISLKVCYYHCYYCGLEMDCKNCKIHPWCTSLISELSLKHTHNYTKLFMSIITYTTVTNLQRWVLIAPFYRRDKQTLQRSSNRHVPTALTDIFMYLHEKPWTRTLLLSHSWIPDAQKLCEMINIYFSLG